MQYYPIFVRLRGSHCLVVGAGQVGRRKIAALLDCEPQSLTVVDPREPGDDMAEIVNHPAVSFQARGFQDADVDGKILVIASTDNEDLNWRISNLCKERGILCNIVDQPEKCSFIVPAMYRQGDLTMAISTGGASPALASKIRKDLEATFGGHYAAFLTLMARARPLVLGLERPTDENTAVFRALVGSELMDAFEAADRAKAEDVLSQYLPPELATPETLAELLDGLV